MEKAFLFRIPKVRNVAWLQFGYSYNPYITKIKKFIFSPF